MTSVKQLIALIAVSTALFIATATHAAQHGGAETMSRPTIDASGSGVEIDRATVVSLDIEG